ncbi:AAA family ATPase [Flavobacterium psychrophilum]|jgi:AAA15 family ATPase/GTPase|uniref:AAA family ATPase n=3 Tax=Flavobacterium psychrophilum TaxID=96345 RepID=UPI0004E7DB4B|nr:ATP-binding protein [Flavobacterium psychrophilum]AIJ36553.1 Abortive infection phage resistance protein [Flavobacterium psychrophilum]EKT3956596.1 ATP-binding protein [Flavobacterium psychrophilum]EKT3973092.1 ATP-binding protein [Flavobacterium psychrophilum]EKT4509379.1 ATP-binding protein [Flavobacterium psychrophilum]EKT4536496.1 ATP-binding protein [Flavobacterium psychrophilum]
MLIRFTVSNFMSFKEETEFNMLTGKGNGSRQLPNHVKKTKSGVEILKTAAIYGANAAGKSNLVKAIAFLKSIVVGDVELLIPQSKRFRIDRTYLDKPSTFRIEYEYQGIHFDYAVEIFKGKIIEEWLYLINSVSKSKEELLFKRQNDDVIFGDAFKGKFELAVAEKFLKKELKINQTVLSNSYLLFEENKILDKIIEAFSNIHIVFPNSINIDFTQSVLLGNKKLDFVEKMLSNGKTGIEKIVLKPINANLFFGLDDENIKLDLIDKLENILETDDKSTKGTALIFPYRDKNYSLVKRDNDYYIFMLCTKHENSNFTFDFDEESDGTNRLFELSPAFEQLIFEDDVVYIIDELERSMHPLLAKELLKMYSLKSTSKSQLIFTTHESHLLDDDLLRRDEIWFTEKKSDGSTEFYPLSNFNPRGDKVLERGYLQGRYGGIPFLGDFSKLIIEENQI